MNVRQATHAKWEYSKETGAICTNCTKGAIMLYDYCPHCGAKMSKHHVPRDLGKEPKTLVDALTAEEFLSHPFNLAMVALVFSSDEEKQAIRNNLNKYKKDIKL